MSERLCFQISVAFLLVASSVVGAAQQVAKKAPQHPQPGTVGRYITAAQHQDYKTLIDLTRSYQQDVAKIKANNPQVLWSKLLADYYQEKVSSFSKQPGYWEAYSESLMAMTGDPAQGIRALISLLPPSCKWTISESRQQRLTDDMGRPISKTIVYVTVAYADIQTAPVIGNNRLKETILEFDVDSGSQLLLSANRVPKGDTVWPIVPLAREDVMPLFMNKVDATRFLPHIKCKTVANEGQPWCVISLPNNKTAWLDMYGAFYRRHGFSIRPFKLREGWGANEGEVQPPAAWKPFSTGGGFLSYALYESTAFDVVDLGQTASGNAKATLRITHTGCTPVCAMVKEFWSSRFDQHVDSYYLFRAWWEGAGVNGFQGSQWINKQDWLLEFVWDPKNLKYTISEANPKT